MVIDGPYGAPVEGFQNFETVVFIGAGLWSRVVAHTKGIGNTPFVSVLRYLREELKKVMDLSNPVIPPNFRPRRVFYHSVLQVRPE
jgi:hypothetical protein